MIASEVIDLPEPDSPINPMREPFSRVNEIESTTFLSPNAMVRLFTSKRLMSHSCAESDQILHELRLLLN
ncbi:unannotated protein [freshwater metagenome]|uniref:Unannotated protein n=1 Tax=freshwater metagenome TaxID=449393 RepID=A0A6J6ZYQ8_9ZZZZ